jgi:hypothetical protein
MKKSELNRLACKWLPVVLLALKVANQFAELVSKVVGTVRLNSVEASRVVS